MIRRGEGAWSLVFRDTNSFTAAASVCGVCDPRANPTDPPLGLRSDRPDPPSGLRSAVFRGRRPDAPLRSVGLRLALKPQTRPVHYKMTLV